MIRVDVQGLTELQRLLRRLPAAATKGAVTGINRTLRAIEQHELIDMERTIDRPTPFTLNAMRLATATTTKPRAAIYVQPWQAKYLQYPIEGGQVPSTLVPVLRNQRLNQYGNIPGKRKGLEGIKGRAKNKFIGRIRGIYGLWQRDGAGVKLLVRAERQAKRDKRWDFFGVGERVIDQRLKRDVIAAIRAEIDRR